MEKKRVRWVDIAKGIGIVLVVFGHLNVFLVEFIYGFHMPLFFILAGMMVKKLDDSKGFLSEKFIKKRAMRIIYPYFQFGVLSYFIWLIERAIRHQSTEDFLAPIICLLIGTSYEGALQVNPPLWFLPCLFIAELLFRVVQRYGGIVVYVFLSFSGIIIGNLFSLPWSIDIALAMQVMLLFGKTLFLSYEKIEKQVSASIFLVVMSFVMLTMSLGITELNGRVDVSSRVYNNVILFYLNGVIGALGVLFLAKLIDQCDLFATKIKNTLSWFGEKSLIILGLHSIVFKIITFVIFNYFSLSVEKKLLWPIYLILGLILPIIMWDLCRVMYKHLGGEMCVNR